MNNKNNIKEKHKNDDSTCFTSLSPINNKLMDLMHNNSCKQLGYIRKSNIEDNPFYIIKNNKSMKNKEKKLNININKNGKYSPDFNSERSENHLLYAYLNGINVPKFEIKNKKSKIIKVEKLCSNQKENNIIIND